MKIERAIQILDPEHREHYGDLEEVNEACRMGMEALKMLQRGQIVRTFPQAIAKKSPETIKVLGMLEED